VALAQQTFKMEGVVLRASDVTRVILENGYYLDFFQSELSDEEYISRTNFLYDLENPDDK